MKEEIFKWILKAENDLRAAKMLIETEDPPLDVICFHAQHCAEKFLKAYLVYNKKPFRKTHNLSEILNLCIEIEDEFKLLEKEKIYELTIYSTELRYPEYFYIPDIEEEKEAILLSEKTKVFVLKKSKEMGMEFDKYIKEKNFGGQNA